MVLDEPTSSLDVSLRARIILLLDELRAALGMTYLFISHDLSPPCISGRSRRGHVPGHGRGGRASGRAVRRGRAHPYTRALLSAVPVPDPDRRR